jgi:hypothetical protein
MVVRRWIALGVGLLLLLLIVLGIQSCVSNQAKQGLKDYNQKVASIVQESDSKVAKPLFSQLAGASSRSSNAPDAQSAMNDLRAEADTELSRAADFSVPGEVTDAQRDFLLALQLRRDGVAEIARQLQPALGSGGGQALARIAGAMRAFDASDVLYSQRVAPLIAKGLTSKGIKVGGDGELIARSAFLPDLAWLDPSYVAQQLGSSASPAGGTPRGKPAPGLHGHTLVSVSVGNTTLQSGGAANSVPASPPPTFAVKIQNGGTNDETAVRVKISITGAGKPVEVVKILPKSVAGQETTVSVPLGQKPPTGQTVTVKATVEGVPGEKKLDNNSQEYSVLFTG